MPHAHEHTRLGVFLILSLLLLLKYANGMLHWKSILKPFSLDTLSLSLSFSPAYSSHQSEMKTNSHISFEHIRYESVVSIMTFFFFSTLSKKCDEKDQGIYSIFSTFSNSIEMFWTWAIASKRFMSRGKMFACWLFSLKDWKGSVFRILNKNNNNKWSIEYSKCEINGMEAKIQCKILFANIWLQP